MNNEFLNHLYESLEKSKQLSVSQIGKSDIEPENYRERIESWFEKIILIIQEHQPVYFVKYLNIYKRPDDSIKIDYEYFDSDDDVLKTNINIHWITTE